MRNKELVDKHQHLRETYQNAMKQQTQFQGRLSKMNELMILETQEDVLPQREPTIEHTFVSDDEE